MRERHDGRSMRDLRKNEELWPQCESLEATHQPDVQRECPESPCRRRWTDSLGQDVHPVHADGVESRTLILFQTFCDIGSPVGGPIVVSLT
jgi:hypothetical protein